MTIGRNSHYQWCVKVLAVQTCLLIEKAEHSRLNYSKCNANVLVSVEMKISGVITSLSNIYDGASALQKFTNLFAKSRELFRKKLPHR